jgi:signal recognition particle GTPase
MIGQDAVNAAKAFDDALDIDGVVLTKLDGDARGGAALSIKAVTGKPIKFAGVGEKLDQIIQSQVECMVGVLEAEYENPGHGRHALPH